MPAAFAGERHAGFLSRARAARRRRRCCRSSPCCPTGRRRQLHECLSASGRVRLPCEPPLSAIQHFMYLLAVGDAAGAVEACVSRIEPGAQAGERGDGLVSRARRVALDGAIGQRIGVVVVQHFPIRRRDARDEDVRVVGRHRGHREDVAVLRIRRPPQRRGRSPRRAAPARRCTGCGRRWSDRRCCPASAARCDLAFDHALDVALHHADAGRAADPFVVVRVRPAISPPRRAGKRCSCSRRAACRCRSARRRSRADARRARRKATGARAGSRSPRRAGRRRARRISRWSRNRVPPGR